MLFIKYGIERTPIGIGEYLVRCPSCEADQWAEIMVSGVYFHLYYIPIFPNDKDAFVVCKKCGLKRYGISFNDNLINNYAEIKNLYRHKWYTYIGGVIILLPFVIGVIFLIIDLFANSK